MPFKNNLCRILLTVSQVHRVHLLKCVAAQLYLITKVVQRNQSKFTVGNFKKKRPHCGQHIPSSCRGLVAASGPHQMPFGPNVGKFLVILIIFCNWLYFLVILVIMADFFLLENDTILHRKEVKVRYNTTFLCTLFHNCFPTFSIVCHCSNFLCFQIGNIAVILYKWF